MAQFLRKNPRPDDYSTAPDDYESARPEISTATGKQILFRVPLRSNRKLVDEEQGLGTSSIKADTQSNKPTRPKYHRTYSKTKPKTLEIVQTRSYPERDRQETVILTDRKLGDQGDDDVPCEIHWMLADFSTPNVCRELTFTPHSHQKADLMSFDELQVRNSPSHVKHLSKPDIVDRCWLWRS